MWTTLFIPSEYITDISRVFLSIKEMPYLNLNQSNSAPFLGEVGQYGLYAVSGLVVVLGFTVLSCIYISCRSCIGIPKSSRHQSPFRTYFVLGLSIYCISCGHHQSAYYGYENTQATAENGTCSISHHCKPGSFEQSDRQYTYYTYSSNSREYHHFQPICGCCGKKIEKRKN